MGEEHSPSGLTGASVSSLSAFPRRRSSVEQRDRRIPNGSALGIDSMQSRSHSHSDALDLAQWMVPDTLQAVTRDRCGTCSAQLKESSRNAPGKRLCLLEFDV